MNSLGFSFSDRWREVVSFQELLNLEQLFLRALRLIEQDVWFSVSQRRRIHELLV